MTATIPVHVDTPAHRSLDEMQHEAWHIAEAKGWHLPTVIDGIERPASRIELLALVTEEANEAIREIREGRDGTPIYTERNPDEWAEGPDDDFLTQARKGIKPQGFAIELADILIRVLDLAEAEGLDLSYAYAVKTAYNELRPERHGGKVL